jgi:hypothetical protein
MKSLLKKSGQAFKKLQVVNGNEISHPLQENLTEGVDKEVRL